MAKQNQNPKKQQTKKNKKNKTPKTQKTNKKNNNKKQNDKTQLSATIPPLGVHFFFCFWFVVGFLKG